MLNRAPVRASRAGRRATPNTQPTQRAVPAPSSTYNVYAPSDPRTKQCRRPTGADVIGVDIDEVFAERGLMLCRTRAPQSRGTPESGAEAILHARRERHRAVTGPRKRQPRPRKKVALRRNQMRRYSVQEAGRRREVHSSVPQDAIIRRHADSLGRLLHFPVPVPVAAARSQPLSESGSSSSTTRIPWRRSISAAWPGHRPDQHRRRFMRRCQAEHC